MEWQSKVGGFAEQHRLEAAGTAYSNVAIIQMVMSTAAQVHSPTRALIQRQNSTTAGASLKAF